LTRKSYRPFSGFEEFCMMRNKQLNVWIPEDLREYVARRAEDEKCPMNAIITDLIRNDIATRQTQFTERTSLMVIQEMVAIEMRKAHAQLRRELREDRQLEAASFFERLHEQFDRLAGFMIMCVRSSGIIRRLTYASLSKGYGTHFARAVYEEAKEKAHQELLPRRNAPEQIHDIPAS
jgi:hypothetical protein